VRVEASERSMFRNIFAKKKLNRYKGDVCL
jgi:hypothetical protein